MEKSVCILQKIRPSRHNPVTGDIFQWKATIEGKETLGLGRVLTDHGIVGLGGSLNPTRNRKFGEGRRSVVIACFDPNDDRVCFRDPIPSVLPAKCMITGAIHVTDEYWKTGYFRHIENRPLQKGECPNPMVFWSTDDGKKKFYVNEKFMPLLDIKRKPKNCGLYGWATRLGIEQRIANGMGLGE
jgi:hypothetical protein